MVEATGLEPVTLCRLVHDEPSCKSKRKALAFVSAENVVEVTGLEPVTLCL